MVVVNTPKNDKIALTSELTQILSYGTESSFKDGTIDFYETSSKRDSVHCLNISMKNREPELADGSDGSTNEWYDADKESQSGSDSRLFHNQPPVLKSA